MRVCQGFFPPLWRTVQVLAMVGLVAGCATTAPQAKRWLEPLGVSIPVTVATFDGLDGPGRIQQRNDGYYLQAGPRTGWVKLDTTTPPTVVDRGMQGDRLLLTLQHATPACSRATQLYVWPKHGGGAHHFNLADCGPVTVSWPEGAWQLQPGDSTVHRRYDAQHERLVSWTDPPAPSIAVAPKVTTSDRRTSASSSPRRSPSRATHAPRRAPPILRPRGDDAPAAQPDAPIVIPWGH